MNALAYTIPMNRPAEPYCPEDAWCEMIAAMADKRRREIEAVAAAFLGPRSKRIGELADLLEDMQKVGALSCE